MQMSFHLHLGDEIIYYISCLLEITHHHHHYLLWDFKKGCNILVEGFRDGCDGGAVEKSPGGSAYGLNLCPARPWTFKKSVITCYRFRLSSASLAHPFWRCPIKCTPIGVQSFKHCHLFLKWLFRQMIY